MTVRTTCRKEELGHYEYRVLSSSTITKWWDIIFIREQHHKKLIFSTNLNPTPGLSANHLETYILVSFSCLPAEFGLCDCGFILLLIPTPGYNENMEIQTLPVLAKVRPLQHCLAPTLLLAGSCAQ